MILQARSTAQAGPRLGAHMSTAGGLPRAFDRAVATGCEAIQIFSKSSSQWRGRPLQPDEATRFRELAIKKGIGPNVAHASYLINLASPDPALRRRSVNALEDELHRADTLGLSGVVLHPGAYTTSSEDEGLTRISEGIEEAFARHPPGSAQLLLEHTAGQGTVLGYRFEHLRLIIDALGGSPRLGVCLDTCHLVAAGYDIISRDGYARVFDEFDGTVGLNRVRAFHLNDSKKSLGSRVDRHTHIGQGCIGIEPFARLVRDDRFQGLPMLLETPKATGRSPFLAEADAMDLQNLAVLRRPR